MEIVLILVFFITLLLLIVWLPFFKQEKVQQQADQVSSEQQNIREQTNIALYHEHKSEIEKDFADGGIDEENYQHLIAELNKSLLQDVQTANVEKVISKSTDRFSVLWPISLSLFIVIFSVVFYVKQGTFSQLSATPIANHGQESSMTAEEKAQQRQQRILAYIDEVNKHLSENPDDGQAWYNLGQTYVGTGEFDKGITAFKEVIRIEGEHADLLGAIAQATYYRNNQKIDDKVQDLIDRALALDANDPSTNILLGMDSFIKQEYQHSITYWQRVIDLNREGVNIEALKEAVNEAKKRLGLPVAENAPSMAANQNSSKQSAMSPQLNIQVSLSEDIVKQLAQADDKTVFVYAIPTNGQRMPLAAVKIRMSDLPTLITLTNAQAMSPQHNLGSVEKVHIFAVISNQGGVGIKSGDYKGELKNVLVNNQEKMNLEINTLVK